MEIIQLPNLSPLSYLSFFPFPLFLLAGHFISLISITFLPISLTTMEYDWEELGNLEDWWTDKGWNLIQNTNSCSWRLTVGSFSPVSTFVQQDMFTSLDNGPLCKTGINPLFRSPLWLNIMTCSIQILSQGEITKYLGQNNWIISYHKSASLL